MEAWLSFTWLLSTGLSFLSFCRGTEVLRDRLRMVGSFLRKLFNFEKAFGVEIIIFKNSEWGDPASRIAVEKSQTGTGAQFGAAGAMALL